MNARKCIYAVISRFDSHPGKLDRIIDFHCADSVVDHRDRRLIFEIVFGVVRNRLRLDFIIRSFLEDTKIMENRDLMRILEIGCYQILYLSRIPDHAAVNESVKLAKGERSTMRFSGLVNGVLRSVIKNKSGLSKLYADLPLHERLEVEFSHPQWLIRRWLDQFGLARTKKLMTFDNTPPPVFIRRKYKGLSRVRFEADVQTITEKVGGYHNLYFRLTKNILPDSLRILHMGECTIQSPSFGWVTALCEPEQGMQIWDVCCAPGGKTTLLSELVGPQGSVFATELKRGRMEKVIENCTRLGCTNVYPVCAEGVAPPVSGTGVIHRHPDARYTRTEGDIESIVKIQRALLESTAHFVGKGGLLLYATCSLEREENDDQVDRFLRDHPEFVLEKPPAVVPDRFVDLAGYLRIVPFEHNLDGAFGARLRRIA